MEQDEKDSIEETNGLNVESDDQEKIKYLAEGKLVSFCGQVLKEASDLQPSTGEAASADIHRVLDLRAPVIVKVFERNVHHGCSDLQKAPERVLSINYQTYLL